MEDQEKNWDKIKIFLNGKYIKSLTIKYATPKPNYIQEVTCIVKRPDLRRFCSPIVKFDLMLN